MFKFLKASQPFIYPVLSLISKRKQSLLQPITHSFKNHNKNFNTNTSRYFLYGGILSWFGFFEEKKEEDPLVETLKRGVLCTRRKQYEKAEQIFHLSLKIAQERADLQSQAYCYDMMANLALERNQFSKAETLFKEVMKILLFARGKSETDCSIIEISLKLADIYSFQNKLKDAETGYKYCLESQEKKIFEYKNNEDLSDEEKNEVVLWAMASEYYGKHCYRQSKYDLAQYYLLQSFETSKRFNGADHPQTLILMNDLGSISCILGDLQMAHYYLDNAIELAKKQDLPEIGSFYSNLGLVYLKETNVTLAKKNCNKGFHLSKRAGYSQGEEEALECLKQVSNFQNK